MLKDAAKVDSSFNSLAEALANDTISRNMREKAMQTKPAAKPTDLTNVRIGSRIPVAEKTEQWFSHLSLDIYWGRAGYPPSLEQILTAPLVSKRHDQDYL
jgi:hypothetical protein